MITLIAWGGFGLISLVVILHKISKLSFEEFLRVFTNLLALVYDMGKESLVSFRPLSPTFAGETRTENIGVACQSQVLENEYATRNTQRLQHEKTESKEGGKGEVEEIEVEVFTPEQQAVKLLSQPDEELTIQEWAMKMVVVEGWSYAQVGVHESVQKDRATISRWAKKFLEKYNFENIENLKKSYREEAVCYA